MRTQLSDIVERSKHKGSYSKCSKAKCFIIESITSLPNKQKIH